MSESILKTVDVVRSFPVAGADDFVAVDHVSLDIPKGCLAILRGRSGSGKTTLLNILGALDTHT